MYSGTTRCSQLSTAPTLQLLKESYSDACGDKLIMAETDDRSAYLFSDTLLENVDLQSYTRKMKIS